MSDEWQVGLIGVTRSAKRILDALGAEPHVRLVALADRDGETVTRLAESLDAEAYTDYRSLIVERKLDALFVAAPPFATHGYLRLAAAAGTPVWKRTPLARRFEEALTLVQTFEKHRCPLVVSRAWPAEPAMDQAGKTLAELGRPFLADARVFCCHPDDLDWRGDSEQAGGGAMLYELYEAIDAVVHWMGPPAEVYAATGRSSRPQTRFPYDTEDSAVVVFKYPDGAIATFATCWTSGPRTSEIVVRAPGGTVRIGPATVAVLDRAGEPARTPLERAPNPYSHPIRAFLHGLAGDRKRIASLARDHLWTMAVIETAYLASRTGEAESPSKWFEVLQADAVAGGDKPEPDRPDAPPPAEAPLYPSGAE